MIHFVTHSEVKANYAERAIKTIKGKIFKYFSKNQIYKYVDKYMMAITTQSIIPSSLVILHLM